MVVIMKICKIISIFFVFLSLQSCPSKEEPGAKPDTNLFIKNTSSDTIFIRSTRRSDSESSDNFINDKDVSLLYSYPNLFLTVSPNETRFYQEISKISISNRGLHWFLVSRDTLLQYTPQTWDRKAGVRYFYMTSYEDYERINFTFEYP
jgi:hypothetical protein